MIVVTGAAGFIGSCIVAKLNEQGRRDLILVDHLEGDNDPKRANLESKKFASYADKTAFLNNVLSGRVDKNVTAIIHMGACSSTILQDEAYFRENNFQYSCHMAQWAFKIKARFIYASSAATYGDAGDQYHDDDETIRKCRPLNLYGESKQKFDEWILDRGWQNIMVGLKFFNVFGPNEYHKGEMRSVVAKAYERVVREGKMALFRSYRTDFADGQQMRDFVYVKDVVDVIMFFLEHPHINGIFNVGSGQARSWNDLASALFAAVGKVPDIEYIDMPDVLRGKYQYFTQANVSKLRNAGYTKPFTRLEDAIRDYERYLNKRAYW